MSQEQTIRELAYSKWEQAGCPDSDGIEFWLQAEQELTTPPAAGQSQEINSELEASFPESDIAPIKIAKVGNSRKRAG